MSEVSITMERGGARVAITGEMSELREAFPRLFESASSMVLELADGEPPKLEHFDQLKFMPEFTSNGHLDTERKQESRFAHFGELLASVTTEVSQMDQVLLAAWFTEERSEDRSFSTSEVSTLLEENRIKVANVSEAIRRHEKQKRVFRVSGGQFRLSQIGISSIDNLLKGVAE